jgi:hypothetical protein
MKYHTLRLLAVAAVFSFIHRPSMSPAQTAGAAQIAAGERVYSVRTATAKACATPAAA